MGRFNRSSASYTGIFIIIVSLILFLEGYLPYWYARHQAPADKVFAGTIAYVPDQNMYFSFISQARDGSFIFNNKLTALTPNEPVFINLEFLAVGLIQRITGISENAVYQVWRLIGILLLVTGFVFMARRVLQSTKRIWAAAIVLLFGGGFGFITAALNSLHLLGTDATQAGIIDMRFGIMPFQQMLVNPHFSFPHGLILIAYGFFLCAERSGKVRDYIFSGLTFGAVGLVRPYDIMLPFLVLPLHVLITYRREFNPMQWAKKLLPLIILLPVLAYDFWLFKINDIFKYWSLQGLNAGKMPSIFWHYLAFGVSGVLAIWRLAQVRTNPLSREHRFLIILFTATFCLIHLGKYLPVIGWSPQVGVYLAVPLTLLGFSIDTTRMNLSGIKKTLAIGVISIAVIAGNISILLYYAKYFRRYDYMYYVERDELETWYWMRKNLPKGSLVLTSHFNALMTAKYTTARVVAAHYSVTPNYTKNVKNLLHIFSWYTHDTTQFRLIKELNPDYIFVGKIEEQLSGMNTRNLPFMEKIYQHGTGTVYKFHAEGPL